MSLNVTIGDVFQARLNFSAGGYVAYNILHYQVTGILEGALPPAIATPFGLVATGWATALYDAIKEEWAACASDDVTFDGVTVQDVYPAPRSFPATYTPVAPQSGDVVGDALPLQDSVTLLKRTEWGTRWGLGRMFFVGLAEADQTGGVVSPSLMSRLLDFCQVLSVPVTGGNGTISVVAKPVLYAKTPPPVVAATIYPIQYMEPSNNVIKTQRRRRPGKGI